MFDLEGDGLYDKITKIHCIVIKDIDTCEAYEYGPDRLEEALTKLSEFDILIGHNILNYDLPVLLKIKKWRPHEHTEAIDTLVLSRLAHPDRPKPINYTGKGGPHSLEAWGYRVGKGKPDHKEWDVFSPAMLRRCRADVEINYLTYFAVSGELEDFSDESIRLEHEIARIVTDQEHYGIRFDRETALEYIEDLSRRIESIDKEIIPLLPKELEIIGTPINRPFRVDGEYSKKVQGYLEENYDGVHCVCGPFNRVRFHNFNIDSTEKVKQFLLDSGWQPESWNFSKKTGLKTSPKLEGDFEGITGDLPKRVKERITWRHRKSQIEGWIGNARLLNNTSSGDTSLGLHNSSDPVWILKAGANPCGTNTGRMRHNTIVNIPKANADKDTGELIWNTDKQKDIYGTQMRSLFIPREDYVLVGHDAAGLELRMLAHYMNDPEFTDEVLNGDIHTFNQERAGLPTRDSAKTFIYAFLYGAGDGKIGRIVGGDADDGRAIKEDYFGSLPKLKKFIDNVKRASGQGYLRGLDGRKFWMRKDKNGRIKRQTAPNVLLQGAGAIIMKQSCVWLWDEVRKNKIDAFKVLDMHDEGQSEVRNTPQMIEPYCELAVSSIVLAGEHFKLNIPLATDYKIGMNMAETH